MPVQLDVNTTLSITSGFEIECTMLGESVEIEIGGHGGEVTMSFSREALREFIGFGMTALDIDAADEANGITEPRVITKIDI